jgi:hypothetical protein
MRKLAKTIFWLATAQAGLQPRRIFQTLSGLPRYLSHFRQFRRQYAGPLHHMPCLHDWGDVAGSVTSEYFGQDLYVAQRIFRAAPRCHVDIGSRIDGFVAHVASFRSIEVIDIRPIGTVIPNVTFKQKDFTTVASELNGYCDSLSCLHALEHFGLGRYGDPLDPEGFEKGLLNLSRMVSPGGVLYLSVPLGKACVIFNAHRISDPIALVTLARTLGLTIDAFAYWERDHMVEAIDVERELERIADLDYVLGVFVLRRSN